MSIHNQVERLGELVNNHHYRKNCSDLFSTKFSRQQGEIRASQRLTANFPLTEVFRSDLEWGLVKFTQRMILQCIQVPLTKVSLTQVRKNCGLEGWKKHLVKRNRYALGPAYMEKSLSGLKGHMPTRATLSEPTSYTFPYKTWRAVYTVS